MNDPNNTVTQQSNGRTAYRSDDLGRTTGTGRSGEPVRGGTVIVEGPNPDPTKSNTAPGNVVTQYPSGNPATGPDPVTAPPVTPPPSQDDSGNKSGGP
jgi:hypothetical protein